VKAAVYEAPGRIEVREVPEPQCADEGLLIKVLACAICGTDVKIYHHGHRHIRPPRITGHELCGEVIEVGSDLDCYSVGQRVAVAPAVPCGECDTCRRSFFGMCDNLAPIGYQFDGAFAELMAVPPVAVRTGCVNVVPANVSDHEAALAEPLACAINGQDLSRLGEGDTVLIIGSGPLGCLHAQLARARGASMVVVADISADRLDMVRPVAGADHYIDSSVEPLKEAVARLSAGGGIDRVIVACGAPQAQAEAIELVAKRGSVNFFGGLPKDAPMVTINSNLIHYREFFVTGTHGSAPADNRAALELIGSGRVNARDLVTHVIALDELIAGLALVEQRKALKVIVEPQQSA
jgi:L-iditol 2-dehydrogenase